jgi:lysozyme
MTPDARAHLRDQLIHDEGLRLKPYLDTVGKLTIGVGRNLEDVGITKMEAMFLLENDIDRCIRELVATFPWVVQLDPVRQSVMVAMCFNLGLNKLRQFKQTLPAIQQGRWEDASDGMLSSLWARQVGKRAVRLAEMMRTGRYPNERSA